MKKMLSPALVAVTLSFAAPVFSQTMGQMNHTMPGGMVMSGNSMEKPADTAAADTGMGEGEVKKVNKARGTVTLAHGALPNGMPPMTMAYKVKDTAWLDRLQAGQKIRFATDPEDGGMTVLRYELVK